MLTMGFWMGKMKLNLVMMTICLSRKLLLVQKMSTLQALVMTTLKLLPLLLKMNNQVLSCILKLLDHIIQVISQAKLSCPNPLLPGITRHKLVKASKRVHGFVQDALQKDCL